MVVLVVATLASLAAGTARESLPLTQGRLVLPGLAHPVDVLRDEHGVPQIYADTPEDLFEAQGYVHAQDRFYEMDVRRHITAGRLSGVADSVLWVEGNAFADLDQAKDLVRSAMDAVHGLQTGEFWKIGNDDLLSLGQQLETPGH